MLEFEILQDLKANEEILEIIKTYVYTVNNESLPKFEEYQNLIGKREIFGNDIIEQKLKKFKLRYLLK